MKLTKEYIQGKLQTDDRWLERGVYAIYQLQTTQEKVNNATMVLNGVGFNGVDGPFMTSVGGQIHHKINRGIGMGSCLSEKQKYHVRKRMKKYAGQLLRIAEEKAAENRWNKIEEVYREEAKKADAWLIEQFEQGKVQYSDELESSTKAMQALSDMSLIDEDRMEAYYERIKELS